MSVSRDGVVVVGKRDGKRVALLGLSSRRPSPKPSSTWYVHILSMDPEVTDILTHSLTPGPQPTEREIRLKNEKYQSKFGTKQPAKVKSVAEKRVKESETQTARYTKVMAGAFVMLLMAGCKSPFRFLGLGSSCEGAKGTVPGRA
jgi:hypothetical protein